MKLVTIMQHSGESIFDIYPKIHNALVYCFGEKRVRNNFPDLKYTYTAISTRFPDIPETFHLLTTPDVPKDILQFIAQTIIQDKVLPTAEFISFTSLDDLKVQVEIWRKAFQGLEETIGPQLLEFLEFLDSLLKPEQN